MQQQMLSPAQETVRQIKTVTVTWFRMYLNTPAQVDHVHAVQSRFRVTEQALLHTPLKAACLSPPVALERQPLLLLLHSLLLWLLLPLLWWPWPLPLPSAPAGGRWSCSASTCGHT
jgi:hypothetical protein